MMRSCSLCSTVFTPITVLSLLNIFWKENKNQWLVNLLIFYPNNSPVSFEHFLKRKQKPMTRSWTDSNRQECYWHKNFTSYWIVDFFSQKMFKRDRVVIEVKYQQVNESLVFVFFSENVQKRQDCYWGKISTS
jgi:hypothetical protein